MKSSLYGTSAVASLLLAVMAVSRRLSSSCKEGHERAGMLLLSGMSSMHEGMQDANKQQQSCGSNITGLP